MISRVSIRDIMNMEVWARIVTYPKTHVRSNVPPRFFIQAARYVANVLRSESGVNCEVPLKMSRVYVYDVDMDFEDHNISRVIIHGEDGKGRLFVVDLDMKSRKGTIRVGGRTWIYLGDISCICNIVSRLIETFLSEVVRG